jgi:hypothetical protein
MSGIEENSLVIVHCCNPREKMWGAVVRLDGAGVVVRGLDLESVEDWLHQEKNGSDPMIQPSTVFVPMHRVLRLDLDESTPAVASYGDRFSAACGRDACGALFGSDGTDA